ncbi:peptidase T [bacterium]|nr:peptidase T [bacterium]
MDIIERFLKYVSYETTSNEESETTPSSDKEIVLLKELVKEMKDLGLNAFYKGGFAYGDIKSDSNKSDTIFLMAHVDTSPDASGKDVKPRIVHFDGSPIKLNENRALDPKVFESMCYHLNHDLIVTDGTTLLGGDDKAGVAIILDTVEKILKRGNYPNIKVCFSPDEEIGRGTKGIDLEYIKKDTDKIYAYTVDGGEIMGFSYENFNAASAKVIAEGVSIHPSIGKNKLINAMEVIAEFHDHLPKCRPENTEGREGFIHLVGMKGLVERAEYVYILRSFEKDELESFKNAFLESKNIINKKYNKDLITVEIRDSYKNMKEVIDKHPYTVDIVHEVYKEMNIPCVDWPIRGGTDGATLSHMGLPCPNLGTGGDNFHGVYEYLDIDEMKTMVQIITKIMDKLE